MNPLTVLALNDALGTQNHAVLVRFGKGFKHSGDFLGGEFLGCFRAEGIENVIGVVMVMMVSTAAAGALLTMLVVMLMMLVAVALLAMLVVMLMVLVTVALLTVLVMMLMVLVAVALLTVLVVMVMMTVVVMLLLKSVECILQGITLFHSCKNILAFKAVPGSCDDGCALIVLTQECYALGNLLVPCGLRM